MFRVDRIQSTEPTGESFSPPDEIPPPVVEYTPGEEDVRATIRLGERARWVADYYPVEIVAGGPDLVVRFSAQDAGVTARLLLRLGPDAELVDGPEVAAKLDDLRARIAGRYGA